MDPEAAHDEVPDDRRGEAWHQCLVAESADRLHLERKDRSGERHAEHRAEPAGDGGHQHDPTVIRTEPQQPRRQVGQAAAHLDGRALAPSRPAEQVGDDGPHQDHRRHPSRHPVGRIVDLVDDQVVALRCPPTGVVVDEPDRQARKGQEPQQCTVGVERLGRPAQRHQEHRSGQASEHTRERAEAHPAQQVDHDRRLATHASRERVTGTRSARRRRFGRRVVHVSPSGRGERSNVLPGSTYRPGASNALGRSHQPGDRRAKASSIACASTLHRRADNSPARGPAPARRTVSRWW